MINSPLEQFAIIPLIPMKIGDLYFSFTNPSLFMLLTLSFVLLLVYFVTKKGGGNSVPNAFQSLVELLYDFVPNPVNEQIGGLSGNVKQKFFPRISVTFTFSLFRNLQGMIPYSFTVTSHFLITLGLSFSIFIGITQDAATPMMHVKITVDHNTFFFLILILVFVSWILVRALWNFHYQILRPLFMDLPAGAAGPLPARAGGRRGDPDDENNRKRIRRAFARYLKTFCNHYCKNMGICGRFCSRGRARFDYLSAADQILWEEFDYHQASANGQPLRNLENLIRNVSQNPEKWDELINSHWVYDLMRHIPKK